MNLLTAILLLSTAPAAGQTIGGGYETIDQFSGEYASDYFGDSVSGAGDVNGDGFDDVIVGAFGGDPGGLSYAGSVFVYSGADSSLLYRWDGVEAYGYFGASVSDAGDVNGDGFDDVIVGAHNADPGGKLDAGSAYLYSGVDGSLLHQWDGQTAGDHFGNCVAGAGDVNGDGYADLIIGANKNYSAGVPGSAFVFSGFDGSLLYQWNGATIHDGFGGSVAGAGDTNGDGIADVIVGAHNADPGGKLDAGSAYLYSGVDGSLLHQWDGYYPDSTFGFSVSGAGDVNGDGLGDVIVSDPYDGVAGVGHAYVYSGADGSRLYYWVGSASDNYAGSVANAGDLNRDGYADVLVGASYSDSGSISYSGSAFAYSGADGSQLYQWSGLASGCHFGGSVSGIGDFNGDGFDNVIVGASWMDPGALPQAGVAYVLGFKPYLQANLDTVSASAGGILNLNLDFPDAAGFDEYKILISKSGTGPTWYGVDIPLTQDSFVIDTFYGNYPVPTTNGLQGTLDSFGKASGSLTVPAGIPAALIGNTYYLAAIANQAGQLPEYSSVAVSLTITP